MSILYRGKPVTKIRTVPVMHWREWLRAITLKPAILWITLAPESELYPANAFLVEKPTSRFSGAWELREAQINDKKWYTAELCRRSGVTWVPDHPERR